MSGVKFGVLCHNSSVLLCARGALESKSHQQLDRCMAATVWAARHHSNSPYAPFTFTPGCMKTTPMHQSLETPTETETQEHVYQKPCREVCPWAEMASDWNIVSNQQKLIDQSTRLFYCVSQSQKQTLWTFAMMCFSMICNCHDF